MLSNGWNGKFYGLCILAQSHKVSWGLPTVVTTSTHTHASLEWLGAKKAGSIADLGWCSVGRGIVQGLVEAKGHVVVNPQEVTSSGEDSIPAL